MRALLGAGQAVVMVPPELMAQARRSARTSGKSDPVDALAVARAALREPDLPHTHLDDETLDVRLLLDHREDLTAERTRMINRLRWHLHDLEIFLPAGQALNRLTALEVLREYLHSSSGGIRAEIAIELTERIATLTRRINELEHRIAVTQLRVHPPARELVNRRIAQGNSKTEALRALKRHLADVVYHRLRQSEPRSACRPPAA